MADTSGRRGRIPAALLIEVRESLQAHPAGYRSIELDEYHRAHHRPLAEERIAAGEDRQRAFSFADREVREQADAAVPPLERYAAADPAIVELIARRELARVRKLLRSGTAADRDAALSRLREWGVLDSTMKAARARHRARNEHQSVEVDMAAEQRRIIRDEVPHWDWPSFSPVAPGLHGLVETTRYGSLNIWTIVADEPLSGAFGRYLDSLPRDKTIRAFGVARSSLSEAMLRRRGFFRSRYSWRGLRKGEPAQASAWSYLVRR